MGLIDQKITDNDIENYGVIASPDKLTGSADENKSVFDRLISQPIRTKLNALIDLLAGATGADEIGFSSETMTADNVHDAIEEANTMSSGAVLYVEQDLTETQKAQARDNIGVTDAQVAVNSVNGMTGAVNLTYLDVGFVESKGTLTAGQSQITISNGAILTTSAVEVFTDVFGVVLRNQVIANGSVTLTFKPVDDDVKVKVRITNGLV